jgi:spore germination protein
MSRRILPLLLLLLPLSCAYRTSVWVAPWQAASGAAVIENQSSVSEANPVWYSLGADGSIVPAAQADDSALRKALRNARLVPTIQNYVGGHFDSGVVRKLLESPATSNDHVHALVGLVQEHRYDGIDIDYESLPPDLREAYSAFLTALGAQLAQHGKRLSVTVAAKLSDRDDWAGTGAEDWRVIGRVASSVKIMAYDFHYGGGEAGPIAPLDWLEQIARYARKTIPSRKQLIGLPWYGYDWEGKLGRGITHPQALELARTNEATIERDPNGELHFRYAGHEVWFQDAESYRMKVLYLIQRHPWIGGFAHWKSGSEDPEVWVDVEKLRERKVRR